MSITQCMQIVQSEPIQYLMHKSSPIITAESKDQSELWIEYNLP